MKVLLITYYWPPAGGSGVQRWLSFVRYLASFDIETLVYTVKNPTYPVRDESLLDKVPTDLKVVKEPIWEPNRVLSFLSKKESKQSAGFLDSNPTFPGRKMQYIRANYFIPDSRKFWIKPSVKKLVPIVKNNHIDVVISTGPPHSLHLIGAALQRKTGVKWLADFRDPWTKIDYFHNLPLTEKAKRKHQQMENMVLKKADAVTVVGKSMKKEFKDRNEHVYVLSNGYDNDQEEEEVQLDKGFSISHIGMMNSDRNPKVFWKALNELIKESDDFARDLQVKLIGKCDPQVHQNVRDCHLQDHVTFISYMAHKEVLKYQRVSQLLLLSVNKVPSAGSVITGKVFEYLQSGRPVIGIGPVDGDLAAILNETGGGEMVDFDDLVSMKELLRSRYDLFKSGKLQGEQRHIERYHRKNLTGELVKILKGLKER